MVVYLSCSISVPAVVMLAALPTTEADHYFATELEEDQRW